MPRIKVTLRFSEKNKDAVVARIMDSYALEAHEAIEFPTSDAAAIVLSSKSLALELAAEFLNSPMFVSLTLNQAD